MKVLILSAGNSIHTVRWANAYVSRGHQVDLVTQHAPLAELDVSVMVHRLPHWSGLGYLLNGPRLNRLVRMIGPNVVNAHYATGYGTLARWCGPVPVVLNVWGSDVFAFPEKGAIPKRLVVRNLLSAKRVVSTSKAMAERVTSLTDAKLSLRVVPFGVDMDLFRPGALRSARDGAVIGTVKTLEPHYGVDLLIEAFARLCSSPDLPPLRLRIVGNGSGLGTLKAMVQRAGISDRVDFIPAVTHGKVPAELHKLDVYVALSREESFGVAVVEAEACGLPVVVSDVGGLPEVVLSERTGFVVPSGDVEAATTALVTLVRDIALRKRMGEAGREFVLANYEWEHCVDRMLTVLQEALQDPKDA